MTRNENIFLVRGKEKGKTAWYFVSVSKLRIPIFDHMMKTKKYNLKSIGTILELGWGIAPPQNIVDAMIAEHGYTP